MNELFGLEKFVLIDEGESKVILYRRALSAKLTEYWMRRLEEEIPWESREIRLFGKTYEQPRLISWHGDEHCTYCYSGETYAPKPWTTSLLEIRFELNRLLSENMNSVLCNLYRNGQDSMGFHSDNEPELGKNPTIVSLSLGEGRRFLLKHRRNEQKVECLLSTGDILVMKGNTQEEWKHGVPKSKKELGPRINLTFRKILF